MPNSFNVHTTAGETGMLFGHWFPSHINSLAGYINCIVNVRHSYTYVVVIIKSFLSLYFNLLHVYVRLSKFY